MPLGREPDANDKRSDNATTEPPGDIDRADALEPAKDIISAESKGKNKWAIEIDEFADRLVTVWWAHAIPRSSSANFTCSSDWSRDFPSSQIMCKNCQQCHTSRKWHNNHL